MEYNNMSSSLQEVPSLLSRSLEAVRVLLAKPEEIENLNRGLLLNLASALEDLVQRCCKKSLSIGVMGEANSGKSTFINAFTGRRLLREDIMEDAARVPVGLSFSDKVSTSLIFADGREQELPYLKIIGHADQFISEKPVLIHYRAPFPEWPEGVLLWELPAIDSASAETAQIGCELAKSCDILFVTTPMYQPLAMTLLRSMRRLGAGREKYCVVLGTSVDLLPKDEFKKMESFFSKRLQKELGTKVPFYFISALSAMEDKSAENRRLGINDFRIFRESLLKLICAQRENLIFSNCGQQAIRHIGKFLEYACNERKKVATKLEVMQNATDIIPDEQRIESMDRIEQESQLFKRYVLLLLRNMRDVCINEITSQGTEKELAQFINSELSTCLDIFTVDFSQSVERKFREHLSKLEDVSCLSQKINNPEELSVENIKIILLSGGEFEQLLKQLHKAQKSMGEDENFKIGGGACAGFLLGALVPGIGWIGAGLAALTGTFLGASLTDSLKGKKDYYKEFINNCFERLMERLTMEFGSLFQNAVTRQQKNIEAKLWKQKRAYEEIKGEGISRIASELCVLDKKICLFEELCAKLYRACNKAYKLENGE